HPAPPPLLGCPLVRRAHLTLQTNPLNCPALGPEPVPPSLQARRRRHAGAVLKARKNRLNGRKSLQDTGEETLYHSPGSRHHEPGVEIASATLENATTLGWEIERGVLYARNDGDEGRGIL